MTELQDPVVDGPERELAMSASTTAVQNIPADYTWKLEGIGPTPKNPETKQKPDRKPSYVLPQDPVLSRNHGGAEEFAPPNSFTEKTQECASNHDQTLVFIKQDLSSFGVKQVFQELRYFGSPKEVQI